jgi:hypothetical protein
MSWFYQLLNPTMNCLLKSPAHRILSWRIMSVAYRGRKTGKAYATPVSYLKEGSTVYCFTNGRWWHNFEQSHPVTLRIGGSSTSGNALAEPAGIDHNVHIMQRYFNAVRADAKFYGITFDEQGLATWDSVRRAAQAMIMIRIVLNEGE